MSGRAVHRWQAALAEVFGEERLGSKHVIEVQMEELPSVCNNPREFSKARKVKLRTASQTLYNNAVELKQFDPNFFSSEYIWCRSPGCKQRKRRRVGVKKEDLYLCATHRKAVEDYVIKMCNEKGVDASEKHSNEELEGYTSMIGTLEKAYRSLTTQATPFDWPLFSKKSGIIQETLLNMRNYLIIVNALLNPDDENCCTALGHAMAILSEISRIIRNDGDVIIQRLRELVDLLRTVIKHILFAFGIIYSWIYLSLIGNPGAQLGAGVGGFVGLAGMVGGPGIGVLTAMGGAIFGGLIGSGVYNIWYAPHGNVERDDEIMHRYQEFAQAMHVAAQQADPNHQLQAIPPEERPVYYMTGSSTGDLLLLVLGCFMLPA